MNTWTQEEIEILKNNYKILCDNQLHDLIPNHTICSIKSKLSKLGLRRTVCNANKDKISYPNKFMIALLSDIGVDFETEKTFKWSDNKRYDNYIKLKNNIEIIIENHGSQHFNEHGFGYLNGRSLKQEQLNDKYKRELAFSNGIDYYFEIDCSVSEPKYIKDSIIQSGLLDILIKNNIDVSNLNYNKYSEFACKNIAKEIYKEKIEYNCSDEFLSIKYHISKRTVKRYLKKMGFNKSKLCKNSVKPIYCIETDTYFNSITCAAKTLAKLNNDFSENGLYSVMNRGYEQYRGLHFKCISEYEFNEITKIHPHKCIFC